MNQVLFEINRWSLFIEAAALSVIFLFRAVGDSRVSKHRSFEWVILLMICTSSIHMTLEWLSGILTRLYPTEYYDWQVWYLGMGFTDFLFVYFAVMICLKKKLEYSFFSIAVLLSFLIMGFIQVGRYIDRAILKTDYLGWMISNLIPALNATITAMCIFYAVRSVFFVIRNNGVKYD